MDNTKEAAIFGGGCFWCTEAVFEMMRGVISVTPGYAGGDLINPTYDQVCAGKTGHVEVVQVEYDPETVQYEDLLTVFFGSHDPTTKDRQGHDVGSQYRSVIFYSTEEQKEKTLAFIQEINQSYGLGAPVVTEVLPISVFYKAENYHRSYYQNNKNAPYCQAVINPKLAKVQSRFGELLQDIYKK